MPGTSIITSGRFTSVVVVHRDQVYAADCEQNQTQVFQHNDTASSKSAAAATWTKLRTIDHEFHNKFWITISISNNQLKCCSAGDHIIKVYSLQSGELLRKNSTRGSAESNQLYCPFISDDDGSALIAGSIKDRLQVMSEQGEFTVLQLEPPVPVPRSAVLFNNCLYVTSSPDKGRKNAIYKYF